MPGRIIPDGQGGLLATWTVVPSVAPAPAQPYQASHVVGFSPGTPYGLPFSPHTVTTGEYPVWVLGENGTAFASGRTSYTPPDIPDGRRVAVPSLTTT